jgi:SAM-dependent methyltransferase
MHLNDLPSSWVRRWAHLLKPNSTVLDLACGSGRHMRFLHELGHEVLGVDRDAAALASAAAFGSTLLADIENGPWPLMEAPTTGAGSPSASTPPRPRQFDGIVVTNYLWRPLLSCIGQSLRPGGVLIYETFAQGNETVGKPSRPDFLLQPGELAEAFKHLRIVAFEDGFLPGPERFVQRLAAVLPSDHGASQAPPARYPL